MDERDLAAALSHVFGPVTIEHLTRLSGGASRETWSFDAVDTDGSRTQLVLRRDPPGRPSEPGAMSREAHLISRADAAGLAVPEVLRVTDGPDLWETAGLVMRRVAGYMFGYMRQREPKGVATDPKGVTASPQGMATDAKGTATDAKGTATD